MKKLTVAVALYLSLTSIAFADSLNVRTVGFHDIDDIPALVHVVEPYAYVSYSNVPLRILDISDPSSPFAVGIYEDANFYQPNGMFVSGSHAYLGYGPGGDSTWLMIIDVSTPSAPTEVYSYVPDERAHDVFVAGTLAYISECISLQILDVSTPSSPAELGECEISLPCHPQCVYVDGTHAYMSGNSLFKVVDVTDPAKPVEVGECELPDYSWDVFVSGNYAYVAGHGGGLRIIDITDPADPVEVGFYDTPGNAKAVYVSDTLAYVADDFTGLRVIDITDPADPVEVGFYETPNVAQDVFYSNGYIYVSCHSAGLRVYEYGDFPVGAGESTQPTQLLVSTSLNQLSYDVPDLTQLYVYSANGRLVYRDEIDGKGVWTPQRSCPTGVYFARVVTENHTARSKVVVVK